MSEKIKPTIKRLRLPSWTPESIRQSIRKNSALLQAWRLQRKSERLFSGDEANLDDVAAYLGVNGVPLRLPLVLISQV